MNYYYDTEFLEGTQRKRFLGIPVGKTKPTIDLISIAIVDETHEPNWMDFDAEVAHGLPFNRPREYYAICKEFNIKEAWNRFDLKSRPYTRLVSKEGENGSVLLYVEEDKDVHDWKAQHPGYTVSYTRGEKYKEYWIRENVLKPIYDYLNEISLRDRTYIERNFFTSTSGFTYRHFESLVKFYGKTLKEISIEIDEFMIPEYEGKEDYIGEVSWVRNRWVKSTDLNPVLYGYYSAYDHVALSWIFGKMINLPKGFPMYTRDLKQILDEKTPSWNTETHVVEGKLQEGFVPGMDWNKHPKYPKQQNEHNALADARWNKKLHEFIKSV